MEPPDISENKMSPAEARPPISNSDVYCENASVAPINSNPDTSVVTRVKFPAGQRCRTEGRPRPWSFSDVLSHVSSTLLRGSHQGAAAWARRNLLATACEDDSDSNAHRQGETLSDDDVFLPSLVMQKSKSGGRLNPKKIWRARSKSQSRGSGTSAPCMWTPQGSGIWTTASGGRQVMLTDTTLLNLSEIEVTTIRQVALARLQGMDLGCGISIPKTTDEDSDKPKRRAMILKKRALTTGFFDGKSKDTEDGRPRGLVFGVPLAKCVKNDRANRRSASAPLRDVANLMGSRLKVGSASAEDISNERLIASRGFSGSQTSCNIPLDAPSSERFGGKNDNGSFKSLDWGCKSHSMSGLSVLDGLHDWNALEIEVDMTPHIPNVISTCFKHLETYGLNLLGIFRVSSSKKRVRQLRDDFDSGKEVQLGPEHCPHDVATLLKEYFRDLPEPLLTKELYHPFVGTQKIRNRRQQLDATRYLIQLLPVANRDTLWTLLRFLAKVAANSVDRQSESGEWISGNKMDANNLATFFGPNILHMAKSGLPQGEFQVENAKRAEERIEVIKVLRSMIDNQKEIFEVPASLLDEVYTILLRQSPEALSRIFFARLQSTEMELDADTGSSICSETTSVSHLPIDVSMEVTPLVISVNADSALRNWERTHSQTESLPDEVILAKKQIKGSSESLNTSDKRQERAGSLGRDTPHSKSESVASRLFRRRDKSAVRSAEGEGAPGREQRHEEVCPSRSAEESSRWFRRKAEKTNSGGSGGSSSDHCRESSAPSSSKKKSTDSGHGKKTKKDVRKDSESDESGSASEATTIRYSSSAQKVGSLESGKSGIRPLMFQERGIGGSGVASAQLTFQSSQSSQAHSTPALQHQQQVSVVDIRKEHLQAPEVNERRLSTPDATSTVISASLTIKLPLSRSQTGPALAFGQGRDRDIPFIEDVQPEVESPQVGPESGTPTPLARQRYLDKRHRSSPFFVKRGGSAESSESKTTSTTKPKTTTTTTVSTSITRTRQRSANQQPPPEFAPLSQSASASAIHSYPATGRRSRESASTANSGVTVSGGKSSERSVASKEAGSTRSDQLVNASGGTSSGNKGSRNSQPLKSSLKQQPQQQDSVGNAPGVTSSQQPVPGNIPWPQETWKRWEIIASEHTEQETVV